jgi:hypothetical protein
MTPTENFKNFLIVNGHYDKFCVNLRIQKDMSFDKIMQYATIRDAVDRSLSWADCKEPGNYWHDVNRAWMIACDEGTQFHNRCRSIW